MFVCADAYHHLENIDVYFTLFFTLELLINMTAHLFWDFFRNPWSCFDFLIVTISLVSLGPLDMAFIKGMRILRVFRIIRVFGRVASLRSLISALMYSLAPVLSAMFICLCIIFIYAILGVQLFGERPISHFRTFSRAVFTLFQISTADSWSSLALSLFYEDDATMDTTVVMYFTSFIVIVVFILLPVVVAVLLENFTLASQRNREMDEKDALRKSQNKSMYTLDPLLESLMSYSSDNDLTSKLLTLFELMDTDDDKVLIPPPPTSSSDSITSGQHLPRRAL